jgi:C4-dicarboxylate transporter DctM subunit
MEMSPGTIGVIGLIVLIALLFARMWIGFAMALVGFLGFAYISGLTPALMVLATVPYRVIADYNMSVLPLFILMAAIVSNTGVSEELFRTAYAWVGQFRGGLAMATSVACAAFAAICGSSSAGTITMGKVAVPEMRKYKYDESLATGVVAAGGTMGILIPPSMGFILYAILTEQSVGKLFIAGIFPGLLLTALFIILIGITAWARPNSAPAGAKTNFKQKIVALKYSWAMIVIFLLVMGGIYGGVFTPTEAGAIGAFGATVLGIFKRRLTPKVFTDSLLEGVQTTGMIFLLILGAFIFMRFLAVSELPFTLSKFVGSLPLNRYVIFAMIIVFYILLGMFTDVYGAMVLTVPILFPVIQVLGFNPIWYGVIMVLVIEMGLITPPVGLNVFILSGVTGTPISTIFRGVWLFVLAMLLCTIIITIFPQIALFLPNTM